MKNFNKFIFFSVVFLISGSIIFNNNTLSAEETYLKIGVVKTKNLENCLYAKDLQKKLEKEFAPRSDKLNAKKQELKSKVELFERNKAIWSEKEILTKERELNKLEQETQHFFEELDSEFKSRQQEELINFQKILDIVLKNFAKQEKYHFIIPDQVVLYNEDSLDCTDKIVSLLDSQFKSKK